ncbi:MAG TPA: hypothetical protein VG675_18625 [Bryobacteraceae bacterium]|nr:hypothetical protein [Bryobacteraceae bacterium]
MFRFDELIRAQMIIRDVKRLHPETHPIFEQFAFRASCDECDIETAARRGGLDSTEVVDALNRAVFGSKANGEDDASSGIGGKDRAG